MDKSHYRLPDGRNFRVIGSSILVERIPLSGMDKNGNRTKKSGLIIPNAHREDATAVGVIRAVGWIWKKDKKFPIDVEVGEKCAFLWFLAETHTNQRVQMAIGENLILLKWEDFSFVWPGDEDYEVSDICSMST